MWRICDAIGVQELVSTPPSIATNLGFSCPSTSTTKSCTGNQTTAPAPVAFFFSHLFFRLADHFFFKLSGLLSSKPASANSTETCFQHSFFFAIVIVALNAPNRIRFRLDIALKALATLNTPCKKTVCVTSFLGPRALLCVWVQTNECACLHLSMQAVTKGGMHQK